MSINRNKKEEIVRELHEKIARTDAILLTDHTGLKVKHITLLRRKLRDASVEYRILKNTLARLAIRDTGKEELETYLDGPTSMMFLDRDVVRGTKTLIDFIKEFEKPEIKIGFIDDHLYDKTQLLTISKLPPREALIASFAGGLVSPLNRVAFLMAELIGRFVRAVDAVRAGKESSTASR
ncbi:MAG: 50S ribosomal protein L10 [Candidatus Glassbacteria bacterium RBG_16_58_8]|uniref:Large ribosomal subunit protein uL10 n=1 Tax=Candidatus Glassbacteria bacterium RBG_16_58_8 TaxID=1817866 RepID=A0A1F5YCF7_9BACT|nr:MAG: 50S ribosomal protein L10 [Candidatus Glassbacteria bacterium RBG_16_58_8]